MTLGLYTLSRLRSADYSILILKAPPVCKVLRKDSQIQDNIFKMADFMTSCEPAEQRENLLSIARQKLSTKSISLITRKTYESIFPFSDQYTTARVLESVNLGVRPIKRYITETWHFHLHLCVTKEISTAFASF